MRSLLLAISLCTLPAMAADVYTFGVSAASNLGGPAGIATGWGYSLDDESSSLWLVPTALTSGVFQYAIPTLIFDFPIVAPGKTVTEPFDSLNETGLFQIVWDASTPRGYVNSGTFDLSADWWTGDPSNGGTRFSTAPLTTAAYSATFTAVPEPRTLAVCLLSLLAWIALKIVKNIATLREIRQNQ